MFFGHKKTPTKGEGCCDGHRFPSSVSTVVLLAIIVKDLRTSIIPTNILTNKIHKSMSPTVRALTQITNTLRQQNPVHTQPFSPFALLNTSKVAVPKVLFHNLPFGTAVPRGLPRFCPASTRNTCFAITNETPRGSIWDGSFPDRIHL
jgi:hypothetical protein